MNTAKILSLLAVLGSLGHAEAAWTRLPTSAPRPIDLASEVLPSTSVVASENITGSDALLSSDATKLASLGSGKASVTIQLIGQQLIDTVTFVNSSSSGAVTVSGSSTLSGGWVSLGQATFSTSDVNVPIIFSGTTVRYVRLTFDVSKPGSIATLSVTGVATEPVIKKSASDGNGASSAVSVNLASAIGGAKAIYAHPTPTNVGEKDFMVNVMKFPRSNEKYQTIIYDLGTTRTIREFSTAFSKRPTRLEVYAFKDLPEKQDWRGKLTLDPAIFTETAPVAIGSDTRGLGRIKLIPTQPISARYVALRYQSGIQTSSTETSSASDLISFFIGVENQFVQAGSGGGMEVGSVHIGGSISKSEFDETVGAVNGTGNNAGNDTPGETPGTGDPGEFSADTPGYGGLPGGGVVPVNNRGSSGGFGGGGGAVPPSNNPPIGGPIIINPPGGGGTPPPPAPTPPPPDDDDEPPVSP